MIAGGLRKQAARNEARGPRINQTAAASRKRGVPLNRQIAAIRNLA